MPNINRDVPLGGVHIKLPFKSMDDLQFYGAYAPYADKLVQTLQEHLQKNEDPEEEDSSLSPEPDQEPSEEQPEQSSEEEQLAQHLIQTRLKP